MSSSQPLDFAALLSRDYRPARLAQIIPKEKGNLQRPSTHHGEDHHYHAKKSGSHHHYHHLADEDQVVTELTETTGASTAQNLLSKLEQDEKANRLVLQLVSKTPAYKRHMQKDGEDEIDAAAKMLWTDRADGDLNSYIPKPPVSSLLEETEYCQDSDEDGRKKSKHGFAPAFHQVELGDWESKIDWDGYKGTDNVVSSTSPNDPTALLQKRRNPFLENISFDNLISWSGSPEDVKKKAENVPLILELGVAGQSIAKHVLPSHRPTPYANSNEYQARMETSLGTEIKSTAELSKGTLHANKEDLERLIEQRQKKRRQMAQDKTSRVTEAMGTLGVLSGGRGRTITSSLMGPGGTERTGRPSRHVGAGLHETEYIEQLDMVTNHLLSKDLGRVPLREYHRPKLPYTIVRTTLVWQFCIRYLPTGKKAAGSSSNPENSSSWGQMMGSHAGAVSKAKLRAETDLTPAEGKLVVFEYCEERPPIQLTKGMASKIVTYYRGDKSRCPVSAGGGDRPTRRKRQGGEGDKKTASKDVKDKQIEKPPRLVGPNQSTTITDWIGKMPKKSKEDRKNEQERVHVLPEGVTEILHPKTHGPFIGEIEDGQAVTGLISNLFVAPIFQQEPESTDFLMILGRNSGQTIPGRRETLNVVLRDLPSSIFTVGQTEPRTRVFAPSTQGDKNFTGIWYSYQLAKALSRSETQYGMGLTLEELHAKVLPNMKFATNTLRQRLKHVAEYDKASSIWTTKPLGQDDYPGVDALGKSIAPESVAAFEMENAATRRLNDLGIHQLFHGPHSVTSVGVTMIYLAGQVNAAREIARKVKKLGEMSKTNKSLKSLQKRFYEEASHELEMISKALRQRHEVAKFIYEELELCPWHLTGEFIDVHKKGEGTGMMKLTGLGDPSGIGEGFSFLREAENKPSKSTAASSMGQTAQMKKITGTEDDLRKLTMKQMGRILKSYGMPQKQIDTLKRWDRVHVIRDLSTKAASDGIGDGLERFARGEKMKLSEQKQMYKDRINLIWKREIASLSSDSSDARGGGDETEPTNAEQNDAVARTAQKKKEETAKEVTSDSESDDDDFAADLEEEMMDRTEANQLVAGQAGGDASLGQLRHATQDVDLTKDARDLAALQRQRQEEKEALSALTPAEKSAVEGLNINRKIIRKRITKTFPDGRQTTTFKFIMNPQEVAQVMHRLSEDVEKGILPNRTHLRPEYQPDEKQVGHSMFEDEDDFEFTMRGFRSHGSKRRGASRRGRGGSRSGSPRRSELQFGKLKTKISKEERLKKRKREEDEMEGEFHETGDEF
jgi:transcription initiation factor TFIID subunit 1